MSIKSKHGKSKNKYFFLFFPSKEAKNEEKNEEKKNEININ